MYKFIIILLSGYILSGCGEGGSSESTSSNSNAETSINTDTIANALVELGPVSGANVIIKALDGYELATYTTDNKGSYSINIQELKESINNYNSDMKFVRIISYGGVDTDVDDDGTHKQKLVQGNVSGIIPLSKLLQSKEQRINLITTAIDKLIADTLNITEEQIIKIAEELGISDINGDNNITIDDIIYYRMAEHESSAEAELRAFFLATIHDSNTTEMNNIIEGIKYRFNIIRPNIKLESKNALISFNATSLNNYIQYGVKDSTDIKFKKYYIGEEITLHNLDVLFFQECNLVKNCSKIQKIYFNGSKFFVDYLKKPSSNIFNKSTIKTFQDKKKQLEEELRLLNERRNN